MAPALAHWRAFMTDEVKRGFAALSPERRREIAAMGGRSVPKSKRTFRKRRGLARAAGRKGGTLVPADKRAFSCDHALAKRAGCSGGKGSRPAQRPFAQIPGLARRAGRLGNRARVHDDAVAQPAGVEPLIGNAPPQPS